MPAQPIAKQSAVRLATAPDVLQLANPPMAGEDVLEAQRLLLDNPYGCFDPGGVDGQFGPLTAAAVRQAKWSLGYPPGRIDGSFGRALAAYLAGERPLPAAFEMFRRQRLEDATFEPAVRAKIVQWAMWGVAHAEGISYSNGPSRLAALGSPGSLPLETDCSAFATLCYAWAGAPNPNASGPYDPARGGYTGTMLHHCRHVARAAVRPADLVVWTPPPGGAHVCIVVTDGDDPWLVSHGSDTGPTRVRFSDEHAHQGAHGHGTVTWLSAFPA